MTFYIPLFNAKLLPRLLVTLHEFKIPCFYDIKHREIELLPTRRFTITNSIPCVECTLNVLEIKKKSSVSLSYKP